MALEMRGATEGVRAGVIGMLCAACCIVFVTACTVTPAYQKPAPTQAVPPTHTGQQATSPVGEGTENPTASPGRPTIMVVVKYVPKEDVIAATDHMLQPGATETMLMQAFASRGFPIVEEATVRQVMQKDELRRILEGDDPAAGEVGLRADAGVVVAGTVHESKVRRIAGRAPLDFYRIELSARAVDAATARVFGSTEMLLESQSADSARKQAADSAGAELAAKILEDWKAPPTITEIHADNADYQRVELFKSTIVSTVRGVDLVVTRSLEGRSAVIEVVTEESSQEMLVQMNRCSTAVPFAVKGISGNRIDIQFLDAPQECEPDLR